MFYLFFLLLLFCLGASWFQPHGVGDQRVNRANGFKTGLHLSLSGCTDLVEGTVFFLHYPGRWIIQGLTGGELSSEGVQSDILIKVQFLFRLRDKQNQK